MFLASTALSRWKCCTSPPDIWDLLCMGQLSVSMTRATELDRTKWGTIVYGCEEGRKDWKKREKEWQQTKKNQRRKRRGSGKEEAKQQRSEREMTRGVEGWERERWKKWESTKAKKKKKERQWKQLHSGGERRGGCHPWLPLITHSLMTLFFSFSRFSVGEGGGWVQPASNQTGSHRVHIVQVGTSSTEEMIVWQGLLFFRIEVDRVALKFKLICKNAKSNRLSSESSWSAFCNVSQFYKHG